MLSIEPDRAPGQLKTVPAQFTLRATLVTQPEQYLIIYSTNTWRIVSNVAALCFSVIYTHNDV